MLGFFKRIFLVLACLVIMFYLCAWLLSANGFEDVYEPAEGEKPIKAVTIQDVLDAEIPMPTLRHVSFPNYPFKALNAFPDAGDDEHIVIKGFNEAPMLADLDSMKPEWRIHYPESLPPVAERLPVNPAVVRGPDGVGKYGGTWHRVKSGNEYWWRRLMYETYVRFDPSGNLQPGLAYDWKVEDENKVYTFYLRKGHRFSNGDPFTVDDLLWTTEKVIGTKRWLNPPDWMQATDGSSMIYEEDILDWVGLAKVISGQLDVEGGTVGKQLFGEPEKYKDIIQDKIDQIKAAQVKLKAALEEIAQESAGFVPDELMRAIVMVKLNKILKNRGFFDAAVWEEFDWDSEIAQLQEIGWSKLDKKQAERLLLLLERNDAAARIDRTREIIKELGDNRNTIGRFNVLFFRLAYSDYVAKAVKTRVKIEAVADEDGDDSHIIRYTFNKPSSFFLNKTATFMFYRVLGGSSKVDRLRHPDGHVKLFELDVFDWQGFGEQLLEEVELETVTPGGQLWKLLGDDVKAMIEANVASKKKWAVADQEAIVAGINEALTSRGFYDAAGWSGIDFELEKELIFTNNEMDHLDNGKPAGFVHVAGRLEKVRRIKEIYVCEDQREQIESEGFDGLSDEQVFVFNVTMFRKAFSDASGDSDPKKSVVAPNREMALDHAANTDAKPYDSWVQWAYKGLDNYHPVLNPHSPTLRAWRVVSEKLEKNSVAIRNPYYYRVDELGNQLPYLDSVVNIKEADREARILKLTAGAIEFMDVGIRFQDYTVLKQKEADSGYEVRLWARDRTGSIGLWQHQLHGDPAYRKLAADPRVRHALSLAINRQEIIDVVYGGIGEPSQYAIPKGSPYYSEKLANAFIEYDPERANRILDEMGLDKRAADGTRLIPVEGKDGEADSYVPFIYVVSTKEMVIPSQAIEMLCNYWREIGINAQMKLINGFDRLATAGKLDVAAGEGGGSYFGPLLAGAFAPTHPAESLQWSDWVTYLRNGGISGVEPPDRMMEVERLWKKVVNARNDEEHFSAWQALMDRTAQYIPVLGILNPPGAVVLVKNNFKNVPKLAFGGWMPHHPGNTCPEAYFIDDSE